MNRWLQGLLTRCQLTRRFGALGAGVLLFNWRWCVVGGRRRRLFPRSLCSWTTSRQLCGHDARQLPSRTQAPCLPEAEETEGEGGRGGGCCNHCVHSYLILDRANLQRFHRPSCLGAEPSSAFSDSRKASSLRKRASLLQASDLAFRSLSLASLCNFELGAHFGRRTIGRIR